MELWKRKKSGGAKRESDANEDSIIIFREKINIKSLPKRNRKRERKKEAETEQEGSER